MDSVELLKSLADPTRLRLISLLVNRGPEICVCDLTSVLGQPQSTVSRQLAILRQAEVVASRRDGLWMHYTLRSPETPLHEALLSSLAATSAREPQLKEDLKRFDHLKRSGDLACCSPQTPNAQPCCSPAPVKREIVRG